MRFSSSALPLLGLLALNAGAAGGVPITAVDLDSLSLGPKIVGPVGPEVNVSLAAGANNLGDLISSVACPDGFSACTPPSNPAGTIYTYVHTVTPGADTTNDPPFPAPGPVSAFDGASEFRLNFPASGFTGVAGYRFSDAVAVLGASGAFTIERLPDGSLTWTVANGDWDTGETVSFFWQTTQPPSGPSGQYALSNGATTATGNGPLPTPVAVAGPPTLALLLGVGGLVGLARYRRAN